MDNSKFTREQLVKKSFELFRTMMNMEDIDRDLTITKYGYIGTDNMTMEQLREHHRELYENYQSLK